MNAWRLRRMTEKRESESIISCKLNLNLISILLHRFDEEWGVGRKGWRLEMTTVSCQEWGKPFLFLIWVFRLHFQHSAISLSPRDTTKRKVSHSIKILCSGRTSFFTHRCFLFILRFSRFLLSFFLSCFSGFLQIQSDFKRIRIFYVPSALLENYNWHFHRRLKNFSPLLVSSCCELWWWQSLQSL